MAVLAARAEWAVAHDLSTARKGDGEMARPAGKARVGLVESEARVAGVVEIEGVKVGGGPVAAGAVVDAGAHELAEVGIGVAGGAVGAERAAEAAARGLGDAPGNVAGDAGALSVPAGQLEAGPATVVEGAGNEVVPALWCMAARAAGTTVEALGKAAPVEDALVRIVVAGRTARRRLTEHLSRETETPAGCVGSGAADVAGLAGRAGMRSLKGEVGEGRVVEGALGEFAPALR